MDTRLRVGRSIAKTESEGALEVMQQIKEDFQKIPQFLKGYNEKTEEIPKKNA